MPAVAEMYVRCFFQILSRIKSLTHDNSLKIYKICLMQIKMPLVAEACWLEGAKVVVAEKVALGHGAFVTDQDESKIKAGQVLL